MPPEFVPVPGLADLFAVTRDGRVFGVRSGRELAPRIGSGGYLEVSTKVKPRRSATFRVHRLVALAFLPNPHNHPLVMHLDNDKQRCSVENLAWATWAENAKAAGADGLMTRATGEDHPDAKLTADEVLFLRAIYKPGCPKWGARAIARRLRLGKTTVLNAVTKRSWRHV